MDEENKKFRRAAKKEYVDTVRELAAFVKKRDKRLIKYQVCVPVCVCVVLVGYFQ